MPSLRILVAATKAPWPPVDGGRLVLLNTIEALAEQGHRIDLVAPCIDRHEKIAEALGPICTPHLVPAQPRSALGSVALGLANRVPATVARHTIPAVQAVVNEILAANEIDVVHAEQLHALPQTAPARRCGIPIVHRAHNVESMLWSYSAGHRGALMRPLVAFEARRMSTMEIEALATTACTIVLTEPDRRTLADLDPGASIHHVPAPFTPDLPSDDAILDGNPAVVTLTSATWAPSRDAVDHLAYHIWPTVRHRLPGAVLHVFGAGHHLDGLDGVVPHPPPEHSRSAFPDGAVVAIPERHPTGVPMKALEAWARGLPLLVDGPTAEILDAVDGRHVVVAHDASGYAEALARLVDDPTLRQTLIDGGRQKLSKNHDPAAIAHHLTRIYRWAIDR